MRSYATQVISLLRITAPPALCPGTSQISQVAFVAGQHMWVGWASVSLHSTLGLGGFRQKFEQASTFTWTAWGWAYSLVPVLWRRVCQAVLMPQEGCKNRRSGSRNYCTYHREYWAPMVPFGVMLEDRVSRAARSQPSPKADLVMALLEKPLPILTQNLFAEPEEQFSPQQEQLLVLLTWEQTSQALPWCGQQRWHAGTQVPLLRWHFALLSNPGCLRPMRQRC